MGVQNITHDAQLQQYLERYLLDGRLEISDAYVI
jgi:hypothetical protein